jgi:hypothetical protein
MDDRGAEDKPNSGLLSSFLAGMLFIGMHTMIECLIASCRVVYVASGVATGIL